EDPDVLVVCRHEPTGKEPGSMMFVMAEDGCVRHGRPPLWSFPYARSRADKPARFALVPVFSLADERSQCMTLTQGADLSAKSKGRGPIGGRALAGPRGLGLTGRPRPGRPRHPRRPKQA